MTYFPKKDSLRDRICKFVAEHGPVSMAEIRAAIAGHRGDTVKEAVCQLHTFRALTRKDGFYQISPMLVRHYGQCEPEEALEEAPLQIVQPRTYNVYAAPALSAKHIPSLQARRNDALPPREVSFLNGSIGFAAGYRL